MMKTIGIVITVILFTSIFWSCQQQQVAASFDRHRTEDLTTFVNSLTRELPIPALSLVVIKGDSLFYQVSGKKSVVSAGDSMLTESTPFFTGRLSPLLVVTAVMRLAAEEQLNINDPVLSHLPYFQLGGCKTSDITIRHLMNQTGGIPFHAGIWDRPDFTDEALSRTTKSIRLQPAEFTPPGSRVKRSPYNYDILADLVAKVSGMDFEDYMRTAVMQPLGMEDSFFPKDGGFKDRVARPHHLTDLLTYAMDTVGLYPANREHAGSMGLHATTEDLAKWLYMMVHRGTTVDGDIFLDEKWVDLSLSSFPIDTNASIGFGWEVTASPKGQVYRQSYDIGGFSGQIVLVPEAELGVALISNISGDFDIHPLSEQLLYWLSNEGELHPAKPLLAKTLGKQFVATGRIDSVLYHYDALKVAQPLGYDYSLTSLSQLGVNLLYRMKDTEASIAFFEACTQRFPQDAEAQLNLAEAYFVGQQVQQCQQALGRAKTLLAMGGIRREDLSVRMAMLEEAQGSLSAIQANNNQ